MLSPQLPQMVPRGKEVVKSSVIHRSILKHFFCLQRGRIGPTGRPGKLDSGPSIGFSLSSADRPLWSMG